MTLDVNGLLQADATAIAGLLILLTLLSFKEPKLDAPERPTTLVFSAETPPEQRIEQQDKYDMEFLRNRGEVRKAVQTQLRVTNTLSIVTIGGIIPFSTSAIIIIFGPMSLAEYSMAAGFGYLIIGVALLVIIYRQMTRKAIKRGWRQWLRPPDE